MKCFLGPCRRGASLCVLFQKAILPTRYSRPTFSASAAAALMDAWLAGLLPSPSLTTMPKGVTLSAW